MQVASQPTMDNGFKLLVEAFKKQEDKKHVDLHAKIDQITFGGGIKLVCGRAQINVLWRERPRVGLLRLLHMLAELADIVAVSKEVGPTCLSRCGGVRVSWRCV